MEMKVILIRTSDGKRIEKVKDYSTPERVNNSIKLFYPAFYKAYAIYDMDGKMLYKQGKI